MAKPSPEQNGLRFDNLAISVRGRTLVRLDTTIPPSEVLTVMGPSGSGKSTLLSAVVGTLDPVFNVRGRVWLDGTDITDRTTETRRIGILFQDELLFPHLSVGGNLAFGLRPSVRGRQARQERIAAALVDVDLDGFANRDPATLSGGERARVALMRMLLSEPRALLLDEPFSRLDLTLRDQVRQNVFDLAYKRKLPVLLVTHDQADAEAAGGRIHILGA